MTKLAIIKLIIFYSLQYGIEPKVALSVAQIESGFKSNTIGITNDYGIYQLNPKSFPNYTKEQLLNPKINIELGVKYLAKMQKECKHREGNTWVICYNMGKNKASKVKYPQLFPYYLKTQIAMREF